MTGLGQLGRYELLEELGRGAMGIVYRARDPVIDRVVAIKTIELGLSAEDAAAFERRFAHEAKTAGRLNHPNIVTIYDMGKCGEVSYIAMELLPGRTLRETLDSGVVLPAATVVRIGAQIADALAFAHRNGVVHCDVKPGNIVVLDSGLVKITDFGIAMLPSGSRSFARNAFGSPRYIAPEQATGRDVDSRSDIFSAGVVLYEMLTGTPAFTGSAVEEVLDQVVGAKPIPPSQRNAAIPSAFDYIVARAMAKEPEHRYQVAEEMAADLRKLALDTSEFTPVKLAFAAEQLRMVIKPDDATVELAAPGEPPVSAEPAESAEPTESAEPAASAEPAEVAEAGAEPVSQDVRPDRRRLALFGVPAALAVLGVGWLVFHRRAPPPAGEVAQSGLQMAGTSPPASATKLAAAEPGPAAGAGASAATAGEPAAKRSDPAPATGAGQAPAPAPAKTAARPPGPTTAADKGKVPAARVARLGFAVTPWGEIYVDGRKRGVCPPLRELTIAPGRHTIEIRNTSFPPHRRTVDVKADMRVQIKHKFK